MPLQIQPYSYSDPEWQRHHYYDSASTMYINAHSTMRLLPRLPNPWTTTVPLSQSDVRILIAAVFAETIAYGIHVIMYLFSSTILIRKGGRIQLAAFGATTVMFILATADIAISYGALLNHYAEFFSGSVDTMYLLVKLYPKFLIHLVNNLIADILLITRCSIIWGHNRIVSYGAVFLLVLGTIFGFISESTLSPKYKSLVGAYILIVLALNVSLTVLTAGKIWWIAREVSRIMGRQVVGPYNLAVGILLESGFIYTCAILCLFILSPTPWVLVAAALVVRIVCIMPILIVAQVALGRGAKDLEKTISAARSGEMQLSTALHFRTTESGQTVTVENSNPSRSHA